MIKILFVFAILFPLSSHAMPKVGDFVKFKVTIVSGSISQSAIEELKLVDYDAPSDIFLMDQTLYVGTSKDTQSLGILKSDLMTEENLANVLKYCQLGHGTSEKLVYKNDSVESCRFEVKEDEKTGFRWYGVVPFGIVKEEFKLKDGTQITKQLIDYGLGK